MTCEGRLITPRQYYQQVAAERQKLCDRVYRRLRWAGERGATAADVDRSLDVAIGSVTTLADLAAQGRVERHGDRWFVAGRAPPAAEPVAVVAVEAPEPAPPAVPSPVAVVVVAPPRRSWSPPSAPYWLVRDEHGRPAVEPRALPVSRTPLRSLPSAQSEPDSTHLWFALELDTIARSVARRLRGYGDRDEVLASATLGVLEAVARTAPTSPAEIAAYARWLARAQVHRDLAPVKAHVALAVVREADRLREAGAGEEEIARTLGLTVVGLRRLWAPVHVSLDEPAGDGMVLGDRLGDAPDLDGALDRARAAAVLHAAVAELPERQRRYLTLAFGLDDGEELTHEEIAERLGRGRATVTEAILVALDRLRERLGAVREPGPADPVVTKSFRASVVSTRPARGRVLCWRVRRRGRAGSAAADAWRGWAIRDEVVAVIERLENTSPQESRHAR